MKVNLEDLFDNLRHLREENDLTIREWAKIICKSKTQCNRWETGEQIISLTHLNFTCNYHNVSMDYIFGFTTKREVIKVENGFLNLEIIAQRVRKVRIDNGLTQEELARFLNTTHSTISQYENSHTLILTSFVYQICKKYKVSADWLCGRT